MRYLLALALLLIAVPALADCPPGVDCNKPIPRITSGHKADRPLVKARALPRAAVVHVAAKSQHRRSHRSWRLFDGSWRMLPGPRFHRRHR